MAEYIVPVLSFLHNSSSNNSSNHISCNSLFFLHMIKIIFFFKFFKFFTIKFQEVEFVYYLLFSFVHICNKIPKTVTIYMYLGIFIKSVLNTYYLHIRFLFKRTISFINLSRNRYWDQFI